MNCNYVSFLEFLQYGNKFPEREPEGYKDRFLVRNSFSAERSEYEERRF